jgi:hypothetical protein
MQTKSLRVLVLLAVFCVLLTRPAGATGYTLTLYTNGCGSVAPDNINNPHPAGANITITATASNGWYFANWTGAASGNVNPVMVTMNSDLVVTGNFLPYPVYSVALVTNGQGDIDLNPAGGSYLSNTLVTATATPASGWVFAGWSGVANGGANPVSFYLNGNGSLTGTFAQLPAFVGQPLSVTNQAGGMVSFTGDVEGTGPLSYQWFFSGGAIPSVTTNATLTLTNVTSGVAGTYWLVAANGYGSATSLVVSLTVTSVSGPTNVVSSPNEASLQAAIGAGGWIGIGFNGVVTLTNTINITNTVILDASSVAATLSGGKGVEIFHVASGGSLTVSNLTLANGYSAAGGAIETDGGGVNLIGCILTNNQAVSGGAVYNNGGTVGLWQTTLANNLALGTKCSGGAIAQGSGALVISNCVFSFNLVVNSGNAYYYSVSGGALAISSGNTRIDFCQFLNNEVSGSGPGWVNSGCPALGGAISSGGTLAVNDTAFIKNQAVADNGVAGRSPGSSLACAGAIYNMGAAVFNRCAIYSNCVQGGAVSPFSGESEVGGSGLGGGIYNGSQFAATNCTIGYNSAIGGGTPPWPNPGPITAGNAIGGGIFNCANATFAGMNLTIATNFCSSPAGSGCVSGFATGCEIANTNGTLGLHNSLIAYSGTNANAYGVITDVGYNICSDASAHLLSGLSYNNTDPELAPLGNYGGPTWCMALLPSSPAIDFGDSAGAPATDQRGYARPVGAGPDIGAFEYGAVPPLQLVLAPSSPASFQLSFTTKVTGCYRLQSSIDLITWTDVCTNGPFSCITNVSLSVGKQALNACYFRVVQ